MREEDRSEDFEEVCRMNNEDRTEATKKADAISKELYEAITTIYDKYGIELRSQSLDLLKRI